MKLNLTSESSSPRTGTPIGHFDRRLRPRDSNDGCFITPRRQYSEYDTRQGIGLLIETQATISEEYIDGLLNILIDDVEETARVSLLRQEYEYPTFIDSEDEDDDEGDSIPLELKLKSKVLLGTKTYESSRSASNASSYLKFGDTRAVSGEEPSTSFQDSQMEWSSQSSEETVDQLLNALIDEVEDVERFGRLRKEFEYPSFSNSDSEDDVHFRDQSVGRKRSKRTVRYYYRRLRYKP